MGFKPLLVCGWPTIFLQYFDAVGWVFSLVKLVKLSPG